VVSGLAPRWVAKPPQQERRILSDRMRRLVLGLLRSPARGKPAHHTSPLTPGSLLLQRLARFDVGNHQLHSLIPTKLVHIQLVRQLHPTHGRVRPDLTVHAKGNAIEFH